MKLKESLKVTQKNNIYYVLDDNGKIIKYKPWLGDIFSCLYDRIMEKSIFPKKFKGSIVKHFNILKEEYQDIHGINLLEIATGSGFSSELISNDNSYTGTDISSGLLSQAVRKFKNSNFRDTEFYVATASDLPFNNSYFDVVICDLSLNFFGEIHTFIKEIKRGQINLPYIENQEQHHRKKTFKDEYIGFLEKYGVEYEPRFLFEFFDDRV